VDMRATGARLAARSEALLPLKEDCTLNDGREEGGESSSYQRLFRGFREEHLKRRCALFASSWSFQRERLI
jgi:hypothetical protein